MASQWLPNSTVNLALSNKLEICLHDRWAQHTTQFHAWVIKCIQTRVKSDLAPILQLGLRELCSKSSSLFYSKFSQNCIIMLIIMFKIYWLFSLFSTLLQNFYNFFSLLQSKTSAIFKDYVYYEWNCNSLLQ